MEITYSIYKVFTIQARQLKFVIIRISKQAFIAVVQEN